MAVPQAGSKLPLLNDDMLHIAGDKPPPVFPQPSAAVSASQLFRAHKSTHLSTPVQAEMLEMQPWREKLQRGSPEFTLNQCRTVVFLSQADFLLFKYKFGCSSLQGFSPYSTRCPFTSAPILPCHHPGPGAGGSAAVWPPGRIMWTARGKMPGNFNTSVKSDLEHPRHTPLFSCLCFPW